MTTVSAWCSSRSRMAEVRVPSLLNISGQSLKALLEVITRAPCSDYGDGTMGTSVLFIYLDDVSDTV